MPMIAKPTARHLLLPLLALASLGLGQGAMAQTASASQAIDADLVKPQAPAAAPSAAPAAGASYADPTATPRYTAPAVAPVTAASCARGTGPDGAYREQDLIGAAQGVFGTGARGLAEIIQDSLHKQGQPIGYIVGREAGGAALVGIRYGSGTLCHKVDGQRMVYWTGPSLGLDAGANAAKTFVLVYNLPASDGIYHRFGAGEGQAYLVGGLHVSYLRYGDVVLIPVRMGVGLRLGINGGYMKFSKKQNWFPF
ncbi:MAG: DUF1134 domain-containing protein [Proteobacteria bacterium]|nr:DUF1134 domain-containing protein [Pseudomonadota bacterium]